MATIQRNYPHNLFLEIAFEQGLVGLTVFVALLLLVGISTVRMIKASRSRFLVLGLLVLYCVIISLFSGDLDDNRLLWLWIGVTLTVCRLVQFRVHAYRVMQRAMRRAPAAPVTPLRRARIFPPSRFRKIFPTEKGSRMARKVCVLTSAHPAFDVRIFHKECKSLARAGYEVTLIATADENGVHDGISLKNLPVWKNRLHRFTRGSLAAYKGALEVDADIYHFHDPELIPTALLLRLHGKKVIYDIHEDLPRTISYKPYIPKPLNSLGLPCCGVDRGVGWRTIFGTGDSNPGHRKSVSRSKRKCDRPEQLSAWMERN